LEKLRGDADDGVRAAVRRAVDALDGRTPPPRVAPPDPIPVDGFEERDLGDKDLQAEKIGFDRLLRALGGGRHVVRRTAAAALATLGKGAELATAALTVSLRDGDAAVRRAAALALGRLAASDAVVRALVDAETLVPDAAQVLSGLGAAALPGLVAALD